MRPPRYPRGPRHAAPDGCPLETQESDSGFSLPVVLVCRPCWYPPRSSRPRLAAWPHLPYLVPGFSPMVRAPAARRPPGSRLARSLLARCQVPAPPRATAHARPPLFLLFPLPSRPPTSDPREPGPDASARIPRAAALHAHSSQTSAVIGSASSPSAIQPHPSGEIPPRRAQSQLPALPAHLSVPFQP